MAKTAITIPSEHFDASHYGIELKEVDFKEFDRRKTPRINNYASFVSYMDNQQVDHVLFEIVSK